MQPMFNILQTSSVITCSIVGCEWRGVEHTQKQTEDKGMNVTVESPDHGGPDIKSISGFRHNTAAVSLLKRSLYLEY